MTQSEKIVDKIMNDPESFPYDQLNYYMRRKVLGMLEAKREIYKKLDMDLLLNKIEYPINMIKSLRQR